MDQGEDHAEEGKDESHVEEDTVGVVAAWVHVVAIVAVPDDETDEEERKCVAFQDQGPADLLSDVEPFAFDWR